MPIEQAIRLGWGLTRFGLHLVGEAARIPLKIAGALLGHDEPPQQQAAPAHATPARAPAPAPAPAAPRPERAAPARPGPSPPPQRDEPAAQPPPEAAPTSLAELESDEPVHVDVE